MFHIRLNKLRHWKAVIVLLRNQPRDVTTWTTLQTELQTANPIFNQLKNGIFLNDYKTKL